MFLAFFSVCNVQPKRTQAASITGLSFEWADDDFTCLQVCWDPVTAPPGGGVTYRIRHSPVFAIDMITCVGEASTSDAVDTSILLTGLDPRVFYSVMVDALPTLTGPGKKRIHTCAVDSVPCIYHADPRNYRSY